MAGRKRRILTAEERDLWQRVAAGAAPLRPGAADPTPAPVAPTKQLQPRATPVRRTAAAPGFASADPHAALEQAHPHMDRRRFDSLRRGRMEPEARLDLHGMTSERAHAELTGFILSAYTNGSRLVLVITGKGAPEADARAPRRRGILRHSVPHWLSAPPLGACVLQVASAHRRHGGAGAFYVYLRRRR